MHAPLPCPFCGASPTVEPWHGGPPTKRMISCSSETCPVGPMVAGDTRATAVRRWNTRAAVPLPRAAAEVLKLRVAGRRVVALWVRQRTAPAHDLPDESLWAEAFTELADLLGEAGVTDAPEGATVPS